MPNLIAVLLAASAAIIVMGVIAFVAAVFLTSSESPRPFLDQRGRPLAGSISEKVFVEINGARQGMFVKGRSLSDPVLLYLHGGMPDFFLTQRFPTGLEDRFIVVWWEQRGVGMSFAGGAALKTLTARQLIEDTKALSRDLGRRFGRDKIYLMGHSGGTFVGLQAAAEAPELYHAYIGVAQMVDQRASEKESYDRMLRAYEERGDLRMAARLRKAAVPAHGPIPKAYWAIRDKAMHRLGVGTMRGMRSVATGLFFPSLFFREYAFADKIRLWRAKAASGVSAISSEILATDLARKVPRLEVPFYVFHGAHDGTVSYALSKAYRGRVDAPLKGFYTFADSAHSPIFEEPRRVGQIMDHDVLKLGNDLRDP